MTETQLRQKVVSIMEGWIGWSEANGKHKKIIDIYNGHEPLARGYKVKYTDAWCATTVSSAFIQAGLTSIAPTECSCYYMIELYKKEKRWMESDAYTPKPGDVIMYDWQDNGVGDNVGAPDHVGIVEKVTGAAITVIEGNRNNSVSRRTLAVNGRYIRGYCLPDYAAKVSAATKQATASKKPTPAASFDRSYAKSYSVTATKLNMRYGPGTDREIIKELPKGSKVTNYGYFTKIGATVWLLVKDAVGDVGYCSKKYLE